MENCKSNYLKFFHSLLFVFRFQLVSTTLELLFEKVLWGLETNWPLSRLHSTGYVVKMLSRTQYRTMSDMWAHIEENTLSNKVSQCWVREKVHKTTETNCVSVFELQATKKQVLNNKIWEYWIFHFSTFYSHV